LRENETTHRNARNTTAGTSPSPSNPVVGSMRGKGSERGRAFAAGRDGARRRVASIETRARARQGTRAPRSERVEPACRCRRLREKYRRVDVFHARLEFRVRRGRRDARNADRGRRRGRPRLRYPYQVPDPKRSDVPLSGGGPVCGHPPRRLTRARRKRRRVARSRRASPMASAWGRGPRKRACAENADSIEIARVRPRAPKMRRPRAPSCAGRASSGPRTERRSASATKATPRVSKAPHLGGDV
jgi:hypothetical protein